MQMVTLSSGDRDFSTLDYSGSEQPLGNPSHAEPAPAPPPYASTSTSRMGGSSSSKPRLSLTEADQEEPGDSLTSPQSPSSAQVLPTYPDLCQLLVLLSSLPPELPLLILSWVPLEKLMEWFVVSKKWTALLLSGGLSVYGHDVQPSTRNGSPIARLTASIDFKLTRSIKRYYGRLNIWQGEDMEYFFKESLRFPGYERISSGSGGLLCQYYLDSRYPLHMQNTIDLFNPVTKECRRLEVPQPAQVPGGQLRWEHRKAQFWGIIVQKQPDRYKVIVQRKTKLPNGEGGESVMINQILVYNSASGLWEMGGTLSSEISGRVEGHIYASTSSRGNLYFLTRSYFPTASERKTPRLIKYDAQSNGCREISPLPTHFGYGEPVLVEHRGDVIFVTRSRKQKKGSRARYLWVFFRLEQTSNLWVRMREMPEDVSEQLGERMLNTVRCHGNGDFVYFYGDGKLLKPFNMNILVHDFAKNSWAWLPDFSTQFRQHLYELHSFQPSLIKV